MKHFLLLLLLLLASSACLAQPEIGSVHGVIDTGEVISISGSGFGDGPSVILFDDFEAGADGTQLQLALAALGEWSDLHADGTAPGVYYSTHTSVSGSQAMRTNQGGFNYPVCSFGGDVSEVYATWWINISGSYPNGPDRINYKSVWMWELPRGLDGGNDLVLGAFQSLDPEATVLNGAVGANRTGTYFQLARAAMPSFGIDTWRRVAFWIKFDPATGYGDADFWWLERGASPWTNSIHAVNQSVAEDINNPHYYREIVFNGQAADDSGSHPMFDDTYVAVGGKSQARVELGNNQVYTLCNDLAILVPDSWSDTSISTSLRDVGQAAGSAWWVFVTDGNGLTSGGFSVTFGSEIDPPDVTGPPGQPGNVTAVEN